MKTIQLQRIGRMEATEAINIKKGDTLIWNFGCTEKVLDIIKETEKTILIDIICESGYRSTRRLNKNSLVAIA